MKKGSAHIVTLVQLLILCAMFSTAFLVSWGFFNDLLTAKQYGLEICALFGAVLLTLTLIAAALVLPPAQSRAAWIAGTVGCLFVLTCHPVFKSFWHSLKNKLHSFSIPKQALSMLATLLVVLAGVLLYFLLRDYSPPSSSTWQAVRTPGQSLSHSALYIGVKGSLITLLVFSFFSYPFDISTFVLQLVVLVALLAGASTQLFSITGSRALFLTLPTAFAIIIVSVCFLPQRQAHYQAMKIWNQADQLYYLTAYKASVAAYQETFPQLQNNGLFLQMYGKALSMTEKHEESNKVLILAQKYLSSQIIQNTLGDNHKAMGNFEAAEKAYRKSSLMIPSSLLPKYLSAKLFIDSDQLNKARLLAEDILNSPIKVESSATKEIIREMNKILDTDE